MYCAAGVTVLETDRSADVVMTLTNAAVLLAGFKSVVVVARLAVLVMGPAVVAVAVMVTVAIALLASVPRLHVTTPLLWVSAPAVAVEERYVKPAGSGSVSTTLADGAGPRLV